MNVLRFASLLILAVLPLACSSSSPTSAVSSNVASGSAGGDVPDMYSNFTTDAVYRNGDYVMIETSDVPNHPSPYFDVGDPRYEEPREGMVVNPNRIVAQDLVFQIPANPIVASSASPTDLGPIGVAVNGVVLFNQYAGRTPTGWRPLDNEIATFDQYAGHPQATGVYHYHIEPVYLTNDDPTAMVGVLRDGFPIYGPQDSDGTTPTDLDACNGHEGVTPDHPEGIYHYHVTAQDPYLCGCYKGTPGAVTN